MVARAITRAADAAAQPFVRSNVAALPDNADRVEIFGHERGGLHGQRTRARSGRFELARTAAPCSSNEIGTLRLDLTAKLLRAMAGARDERGRRRTVQVDVRILGAHDLKPSENAVSSARGYGRPLLSVTRVAIHVPRLTRRP